jgi:methylenetetrahydrofolate dehydrogenase (NADP+) / methenyltetrahydrofolate cyclohydrolase
MILNGRALSEQILQDLTIKLSLMNRKPGLAVVLVGEDSASKVYVGSKLKTCERLGIHSQAVLLPTGTTQANLESILIELNQNSAIDAILVQLPLPKHFNSREVLQKISAKKDVDGLSYESLGRLVTGDHQWAACTPSGVIALLQANQISLKGKHAVVVGRSNIVGRPMALLLEKENATVTICHSHTENLSNYTSRADLVVLAAGQAQYFTAEYFSSEAVVIDVGIHRLSDGTLCGDLHPSAFDKVKAYSPVPGGVGPLTIAFLMKNTYLLAKLNGK